MESNKFFVFVNRFNSIVFMLLLLSAGASLAYLNMMSSEWSDRRSVTLKEAPESNREIELVLGNIDTVSGSSVLYVNLRERNNDSSYGSGSGGQGGVRNVLFFKDAELNPSWLFGSNANLIQDMDELKVGENNDKNPAISFLYEMIYKDTNGNQKLDGRDKISIAISKPDGSGFRNIIESIDSLIDHQVSSDGKEVAVIYQSNHKVYLERISLLDFQSLSKYEITQIEKI